MRYEGDIGFVFGPLEICRRSLTWIASRSPPAELIGEATQVSVVRSKDDSAFYMVGSESFQTLEDKTIASHVFPSAEAIPGAASLHLFTHRFASLG